MTQVGRNPGDLNLQIRDRYAATTCFLMVLQHPDYGDTWALGQRGGRPQASQFSPVLPKPSPICTGVPHQNTSPTGVTWTLTSATPTPTAQAPILGPSVDNPVCLQYPVDHGWATRQIGNLLL
ncbi:hypothetical protein Bbelb_293350 [Branchiostoma belcheri]|nr:hypothetical protein Bbelb_293350 [Branchiostoma belcheri]